MMPSRSFALLCLSPAAYAEIREKLDAAGYSHAFVQDQGGEVIDMQGIALRAAAPATARPGEDDPRQEAYEAARRAAYERQRRAKP